MDRVWQFLSLTVHPDTWLTGNTVILVAMFVLSGAVAIVGYAQMHGEHRHSVKVGGTNLVAGVIAGVAIFFTWDYLRTMNRWESLPQTTDGRIGTLIAWTSVVFVVAVVLIGLGWYTKGWNNLQAPREEKRTSYAGKFMTGAGMLLFIHIAFMVLRIVNESRLIDNRICGGTMGTCSSSAAMAMMPMWPLAILGLAGLGWMLFALPGFVMWRRGRKMLHAASVAVSRHTGNGGLI